MKKLLLASTFAGVLSQTLFAKEEVVAPEQSRFESLSKLTKVIVYGSYARGDYNSSSDVDVMILVKMSDNEIKKIENQVYDLAFDIEMDTGVDISPIIKNEEQYEYWLDTLPFYKNIHEEGVIVNG